MQIQKINITSCSIPKKIKKFATAAMLSTAVLAGASAVTQTKTSDNFQKNQIVKEISLKDSFTNNENYTVNEDKSENINENKSANKNIFKTLLLLEFLNLSGFWFFLSEGIMNKIKNK